MKILFLDESGDHSLSKVDPQYPVFVLGGIISEKEYAEGEMTEEVNAFKRSLFGRTDIVLHTADIVRNRNGFERMSEVQFRSRFYMELNALMRKLKYSVVACVIRKDEHLARYGIAALDPYLLSLNILVERFCFEIGSQKAGGMILAEKREATLDANLEIAWLSLKVRGTDYLQPSQINERIIGLSLRSKTDNLAGLQLADLVVSPIGRHVLKKSDREDFRIIESKFRCDRSGEYRGFGLVVLPK